MNRRSILTTLTGGAVATAATASTVKSETMPIVNNTAKTEKATLMDLAYKIAAGKRDKKVFYIDVGNLPKTKAEQYVNSMMKQFRETSSESAYFIPRRDNNGPTTVEIIPGVPTTEEVLAVYRQLKQA